MAEPLWKTPWPERRRIWLKELAEEATSYYETDQETITDLLERAVIGTLEDLQNDLTRGRWQRFYRWRLARALAKRTEYVACKE